MSEVKRPLEGVKVLELATFIAAPCCARFLADLGAEVIKVEAPAGDPLRYTAVNEGRPQDQKENTSYDLENAGKTCVCLNTKTPAGREALEKLIAEADIFITNWRQNPLKKAGLDYETLHAKLPQAGVRLRVRLRREGTRQGSARLRLHRLLRPRRHPGHPV